MEQIKVLERDTTAKKNKTLRSEGFVPAVVYNTKTESTSIMIDSKLAIKVAKESTSTTIWEIDLEGKNFKVLVKEIDYNPVTDEIRHISFFEIDETKDMVFTIPFEIIGIAPAVKNNLGVLIQVLDDIDVRCKVNELIPAIQVDISGLVHPGQSLGVDDLKIPETISIINEDLKHATVVTITELQKEDTKVTTEATEGESTESAAEEDKADE